MGTYTLGLVFIPMPEGEVGPPIMRVEVKSPLGGGEKYPEPFTNAVFLTLQEYHPAQLEAQVRELHAELDEIVKEAHRKYDQWQKSKLGLKRKD